MLACTEYSAAQMQHRICKLAHNKISTNKRCLVPVLLESIHCISCRVNSEQRSRCHANIIYCEQVFKCNVVLKQYRSIIQCDFVYFSVASMKEGILPKVLGDVQGLARKRLIEMRKPAEGCLFIYPRDHPQAAV